MIYYFSGTGNSLHVAKRLSELLPDERLISIAECLATGDVRHTLKPGEKIGWVFPIYSWGPPPIVTRFIVKHWHIYDYTPETYVYMVAVCGDEIGLSAEMWRKALGGIKGKAAFSVQMPNNYILLPGFDVDPKELEKQKIAQCEARIAAVAQAIQQQSEIDDVVIGPLKWVKSRLIYPLFKHCYMSDKAFRASDECNGCGLCQKSCPAHNITLRAGRPQWHGHCEMCLSCIHRCPHRAINYGKITKSKGLYFFK